MVGGSRWYVAATHARAEGIAQAHLDRQGFASFCPRFRKTRRHARRSEEVLAPVFPGYLFVSFDSDRDNWTAINGTRGIRRLIASHTSRPQPVPSAVMDALRARCDGQRIGSLCQDLTAGQRVRIVAGPLADFVARIEHLTDGDRVRVLLDLLGSQTSVAISASVLEPA
jgi:transcription elongation factor/antiterminator RfaH